MWLAAQTFMRGISPKAWAVIAMGAAALILAVWLFQAGRGAEREDVADKTAKVEARAATGRETAATERAIDTAATAEKLEQWNHDAEQTPDAPPDDRELRRRCRQLWDVGQRGLAACRRFEAEAQAGPVR